MILEDDIDMYTNFKWKLDNAVFVRLNPAKTGWMHLKWFFPNRAGFLQTLTVDL
jgi:hypothetical protein